MRRARSAVLVAVFVSLSLAASCGPPTLTTKGHDIYTAIQISQRIDELQNAAMQANTTGALADGPAVLIVRFTVSAQKTLQTVPTGWQQTLVKGWTELKQQLPPVTNPAVAAAFGAVDAILGAWIGGPNG